MIGLLRAELTESLVPWMTLLFPLTEKAAREALVGAPKLGPTVFAPLTNTKLAVLPLPAVRRWMVEGNLLAKIMHFFCATALHPNALQLQLTKTKK